MNIRIVIALAALGLALLAWLAARNAISAALTSRADDDEPGRDQLKSGRRDA